MKTVLSNRPFVPATDNKPQPDNGQTLCYTERTVKRPVKIKGKVEWKEEVSWDAFIQAFGNKRVPIEKDVPLSAIVQKAKESGRKLVYVRP